MSLTTKTGTTLSEAILEHLKTSTSGDESPEELAESLAYFLERRFMEHTWINGFSLIHPSEDLIRDVGLRVIEELKSRRQVIDTLGVRTPAAYMWWNAS